MLGLAAGTFAQNLPNYVPADGLVGWWPFNGNANDESGNGNNGTVNGATLSEDRFGNLDKAYNFDGINDDILVPHNPSFNSNPITINLWMKSNGDADGGNLITKYCCSNWQGWTIQVSGADADTATFTREYLRGGCQGIYQWYCGAEPQQRLTAYDEQWHMYTFRVDNSGATVFWDGIIVATQNWVGPAGPISNSLNMCIGSYFSNGYFYTGMLDDIAIYNRALTQEEITALYTGEPTNPTTACNPLPTNLQNGLVGYWPFCGNANDESGNGNDGTVNGATLTEDRFGDANTSFNFDGISNYIELPLLSEINNLSQLSFSMWLRSDFEFNELYRTAFAHWITSGIGSGAVGLQVAFGGQGTINQGGVSSALIAGIGSWSADNLVTPNTWTQALIVFDGTQSNPTQRLQLYLNGQFSGYYGDSSIPESIGNTAEKTVIGASVGPVGVNNTYNYFNGSLDDIGIWNRALTADEVQQLYTLNACTFTVYDTVTVTQTVYDTVTTYTTVTDTLIINTLITGINPPNNSNTIKVFPNPAGSFLTIDYGNFALMSGYQLRIENSLGQQVFQTNITQQTDSLSLSTWGGNGLYFVHIVDPQGNTIDIRKIVLQ